MKPIQKSFPLFAFCYFAKFNVVYFSFDARLFHQYKQTDFAMFLHTIR